MLSARELERLLIERFDESQSLPLSRTLSALIEASGVEKFEAAEQAEKMARSVKRLLEARLPNELPFEFGNSDPMRLIGKRRVRTGENEQTRFARMARPLVASLHDALCECSDEDFETVCAAALVESGASKMTATCSGDDGGIDIYGRLPLRAPDENLPPGVLETTLLPHELLVLGQCKRFHRDARIGRPELQKFLGAVSDCLKQYEGNVRPPTRRVPESYYRREEPCIKVFLTTADYADTSLGEAQANDVVLVAGQKLAQFLIARRTGIESDQSTGLPAFKPAVFQAWLAEVRKNYRRS
jgi:hypothetical protein